MGRAFAMVLAGIVSAPRVGRSARRWRSPDSGGANWLGPSAAAMPGISGFPQACWRFPTRASGRNHWRQIAHGLFRASGLVMLHGHHELARPLGFSSSCLGQFWKAEVGHFSRAPKSWKGMIGPFTAPKAIAHRGSGADASDSNPTLFRGRSNICFHRARRRRRRLAAGSATSGSAVSKRSLKDNETRERHATKCQIRMLSQCHVTLPEAMCGSEGCRSAFRTEALHSLGP